MSGFWQSSLHVAGSRGPVMSFVHERWSLQSWYPNPPFKRLSTC